MLGKELSHVPLTPSHSVCSPDTQMTRRYLDESSSSLSCIYSHFPLSFCVCGAPTRTATPISNTIFANLPLLTVVVFPQGAIRMYSSHRSFDIFLTIVSLIQSYCEHTEDIAWVFRFSLAQACFGILLCLEEVPSKCERIGLSGAESICETLRPSLPVLDSPWYTSSLLSPKTE